LNKNLPSKKKEVIQYKIQVHEFLCWEELPKVFTTLESADKYALVYRLTNKNRDPRDGIRIVKRTDKGWEVVE